MRQVRVIHQATDVVTPYAYVATSTDGDATPAEELAKPASASFMTLGGVLNVELLSLPPVAKKIKGWTLRPVTGLTTAVQRQPYPVPPAGSDASSAPPPGSAPPLRIVYEIDKSIILPNTMHRVGWWDAEAQAWKVEGISQIEFAEPSRSISFLSSRLTALALLQHTHLELPYRNWLITPIGASQCELTLLTQRFTVLIRVTADGCTLAEPKVPELTELLERAMPATTMLLKLRASGINLMPRDADAAQLDRITPKHADVEHALNASIVPLLPSYQLGPSRWNLSRGPAKCTLRLKSKTDTPDVGLLHTATDAAPVDPFAAMDADWPTMEFASRRVLMIRALDTDATCDDAAVKGTVAHSTPLECLKNDNPELRDVLNASSRLFQDNTRQLLNSLRLFSFTSEPP